MPWIIINNHHPASWLDFLLNSQCQSDIILIICWWCKNMRYWHDNNNVQHYLPTMPMSWGSWQQGCSVTNLHGTRSLSHNSSVNTSATSFLLLLVASFTMFSVSFSDISSCLIRSWNIGDFVGAGVMTASLVISDNNALEIVSHFITMIFFGNYLRLFFIFDIKGP